MYKYKSRRTDCVRFVFKDGRQVNLLGFDTKFIKPETAQQTETIITIPGATDKDFELILSDPAYASLHNKIEKIEQEKPAKKEVKKPSVKQEKSNVSKKKSADVSTEIKDRKESDSQ